MNDYELLYMIDQKDHHALDLLLSNYERFRWYIVHRVCYNPQALRLELEDLYQEATIGFLNAVRTYDPELMVRFSVYAYHCCLHQVRLSLRRHRGRAYQLLNNALSLDYPVAHLVNEESGNLEEIIEDNNPAICPIQTAHFMETKVMIIQILDTLPLMEKEVFYLRNQGYAYADIAQLLDTTPKKVDNILQKIRRLAKQRIDLAA